MFVGPTCIIRDSRVINLLRWSSKEVSGGQMLMRRREGLLKFGWHADQCGKPGTPCLLLLSGR